MPVTGNGPAGEGDDDQDLDDYETAGEGELPGVASRVEQDRAEGDGEEQREHDADSSSSADPADRPLPGPAVGEPEQDRHDHQHIRRLIHGGTALDRPDRLQDGDGHDAEECNKQGVEEQYHAGQTLGHGAQPAPGASDTVRFGMR